MTGDVPQRLLLALNAAHAYLSTDDAFFTGIIAERAVVARVRATGINRKWCLWEANVCHCVITELAVFQIKGVRMIHAWENYIHQRKQCNYNKSVK